MQFVDAAVLFAGPLLLPFGGTRVCVAGVAGVSSTVGMVLGGVLYTRIFNGEVGTSYSTAPGVAFYLALSATVLTALVAPLSSRANVLPLVWERPVTWRLRNPSILSRPTRAPFSTSATAGQSQLFLVLSTSYTLASVCLAVQTL